LLVVDQVDQEPVVVAVELVVIYALKLTSVDQHHTN
tara:strand:- start:505 stop:612 length:108 start_codon:yes stop_codon:yes gene_type:complete